MGLIFWLAKMFVERNLGLKQTLIIIQQRQYPKRR
jgi:hypothetical protein